jgi:hypothetical protein
MKRRLFLIFVFFSGMTIFAQDVNTVPVATGTPAARAGTGPDMSYYSDDYFSQTATFFTRYELLKEVQSAGLTGIGEFYHAALKHLISKIPDIKTGEDRELTDFSARIICNGLAAEQYTPAAPEIWQIVQFADTVRSVNDGILMQQALIALGQVGDTNYVSSIALRLDNYNAAQTSDAETRRRVQRGAVGCINALEALSDPAGYRPVFYASIGWFDRPIQNIAYNALPSFMDDPGEVISVIIRESNNPPNVKYAAWREMLRSSAPDESKAKVASTALAIGWSYITRDMNSQRIMREMRISAMDTIAQTGIVEDSDYVNLKKSYDQNFVNNTPDYNEIRKTISTLSSLATDEAVEILVGFLAELNERRRSGPWDNRERNVFSWVVAGLGATKTVSPEARTLLTFVQRSQNYTPAEQTWARNALTELSQ